jgi:hypothetical protein
VTRTTDHLQYLCDLIDDIDTVEFGRLSVLFDNMGRAVDAAVRERDLMVMRITELESIIQNDSEAG